jgi:hypothetical protein
MRFNLLTSHHCAGVFLGLLSTLGQQSVWAQAALPVLSDIETKTLFTQKTHAYALVARPSDTAHQSVDLVTLDPTSLRPTARGVLPDVGCARLHGSNNGSLVCIGNQVKQADGQWAYRQLNSRFMAADAKQVIPYEYNDSREGFSRARISNDGTLTAWTNFIYGGGYQDAGMANFVTATYVGQIVNGKGIASNIATWVLLNKGSRTSEPDLKYWGITYHPHNTATQQQFLVTAFFQGKPHLAQGDMATKTMTVIAEGVECPSYSPDGKRIAFKKRIDSTHWAVAIMDLASKKETVFKDLGYSVDDQIDWLNDNTLIYETNALSMIGPPKINLHTLDITVLPEKARSQLWLADARSAAVYLPRKLPAKKMAASRKDSL